MRESMRDILKKFRADMVLSAIVCIVTGVILVVYPATTLDIICKIIAIALIVMGAAELVSYFWNKIAYSLSGILGFVVLLIGIWIFVRPESVLSLIPIVIGVILAIHGIQDLKLSFETRKNGYNRWWGMMIMALISLALGVVCIVNAFGVVTVTIQIIGIAMVYDGLSDLWIAYKATKFAKAVKEEAEALDVEYKEAE